MLKRLLSLAMVCAMLAGLYVPVSAADAYALYAMDGDTRSLGGFGHYVAGAVYNGFREGDALPGKTGETVYEVTTKGARRDALIRLQNMTDRYTAGEKLHFSTEFMIPEGNTYYSNSGPTFNASFFTKADSADTTTTGLGVKNDGNRETKATDRRNVISFNPSTKKIQVFGKSVYTDVKWEENNWYKVDVVVETGAKPKAAIYVDGQPLIVNADYGNGVTFHKNDADATFDGIKTATDYVNVGGRDDSLNYFDTGIYGISGMSFGIVGGSSDDSITTMYMDNMSYKVLPANENPVIDSALKFKGLSDGATVDRNALKAVSVTLPEWIRGAVAKVSVSADGNDAAESTAAPFTFDLSAINRGLHNFTISAYDANGNLLKSATRSLVVAGAEEQTMYYMDFNASPFYHSSELYQGSTPHYNNMGDNTDVRKTTFEDVTDANGVTKRAAKLYSVNNTSELRLGYVPADGKVLKTGIVKVNYDMYIDNDNITSLQLCRKKSYPFALWDAEAKKFKTYNFWTGLKEEIYFDAAIGRWQNWEWTLDFEKGGMASLKIDGKTAFENVAIQSWSNDSHGYLGFVFAFLNSAEAENFIAVDDLKVTRYTGIEPVSYDMYDINVGKAYSEYTWAQIHTELGGSKKAAVPSDAVNSKIYGGVVADELGIALNEDFGESVIAEFSADDAYTADGTHKFAIPISMKQGIVQIEEGRTTVEYDFYLDNLNHNGMNIYLNYTSVAGIAAGTSKLKFSPFANQPATADIKVGQWQKHKMVMEYNDGDKVYVQYFVDGESIYYGYINYLYTNNTGTPTWFYWQIAGADNNGFYAANKMAIDNVKYTYEPIIPYINSVDFGEGNEKGGLVKAGATSANLALVGNAITADSVAGLVSVAEKGAETALEGITVTAAASASAKDVTNINISGLALEAGKTYTITIAPGIGFDSTALITHEPIEYTFTAVENFEEAITPDDGVAGNITVADVRFTVGSAPVYRNNVVKPYTGTLAEGQELRADVMVNNASDSAETFRVIIATYSGNKLVGVSVGEECTVSAKATNRVVTSGNITIGTEENLTAKVMIVDETNKVAPLSRAFDLK